MAANSDGASTTIVTCEGDLSDPRFSHQLEDILSKLETILGDEPKVRKLEPWNSVRVTLSLPREAALRLRQLASNGSQQLRALGILSVQVEGDQVISLRLASTSSSEPQEVILETIPQDDDRSNPQTSTSNAEVPTPEPTFKEKVQFRSPNVVCPTDTTVPKVPLASLPASALSTNAKSFSGPFPFTSMNQAITSRTENPTTYSGPPPPYPGKAPQPVTISSPLLVNLLQNEGASGSAKSTDSTNSTPSSSTSTGQNVVSQNVMTTQIIGKYNPNTQMLKKVPHGPGRSNALAPSAGLSPALGSQNAAVPVSQSSGQISNQNTSSAAEVQQNLLRGSSGQITGANPVNHPVTGVNHSVSGVNHSVSAVNHPVSGVNHPVSPLTHPISGVSHQISGAVKHHVSVNHQLNSVSHQIGSGSHQISGSLQNSGNHQISGSLQNSGNHQISGSLQSSGNHQISGSLQNSGNHQISGSHTSGSHQIISHQMTSANLQVAGGNHANNHQISSVNQTMPGVSQPTAAPTSQSSALTSTGSLMQAKPLSGHLQNNLFATSKNLTLDSIKHMFEHPASSSTANHVEVLSESKVDSPLSLTNAALLVNDRSMSLGDSPMPLREIKPVLVPYKTNSLYSAWDNPSIPPLQDLTPSLTELKPDDLDSILPSLERDLANSPPLPEELVTAKESRTNFLINPLTGELEPQSSSESEPEDVHDVFTGLPSPATMTDDDTNSTIRPDTTDQSDSETRSSHSDSGKHFRLKSTKSRDKGRDSPSLKAADKFALKPSDKLKSEKLKSVEKLNLKSADKLKSSEKFSVKSAKVSEKPHSKSTDKLKPTEKIKLRLKLEKSEPINQAYKVDVSFINAQSSGAKKLNASTGLHDEQMRDELQLRDDLWMRDELKRDESKRDEFRSRDELKRDEFRVRDDLKRDEFRSRDEFKRDELKRDELKRDELKVHEELRVPPLHISLRGRNHAVINNKKKIKLEKSRKLLEHRKKSLDVKEGQDEQSASDALTNRLYALEHMSKQMEAKQVDLKMTEIESKQIEVNESNASRSNQMKPLHALMKTTMEAKKLKKGKLQEYRDQLDAELKRRNLDVYNIHYKEKNKERRGSDSELVKARQPYESAPLDSSMDKKRRLSQTEEANFELQPLVLGSTNTGTIPNHKMRKEKLKLKESFKTKDLLRNKKIMDNGTKQVPLPIGDVDMEAKIKQRLLEEPHYTNASSACTKPCTNLIYDQNSIHNTNSIHDQVHDLSMHEPRGARSGVEDLIEALSDVATVKDKPLEPDKCNTPDGKSDLSDKQTGRSPNSGAQGEDSGIESMDALSEKSPNQASQSPHDVSDLKSKNPGLLDIEAQLAKMEGFNGADPSENHREDLEKCCIGDLQGEIGLKSEMNLKGEMSLKSEMSLKGEMSLKSEIGLMELSETKKGKDSKDVSVKKEGEGGQDLDPLPLRINPPLYTYSNPEKGRASGSESPTSDSDSNICTKKSLLEQLLIEIPDNQPPSSPSPATRSLRTRASSKLNSPELNSPVPSTKPVRLHVTTKRKRHESEGSNNSLDDVRNKKAKKTALENTLEQSRGAVKKKVSDESSDSDEPLIEIAGKVRKSNQLAPVRTKLKTPTVNNAPVKVVANNINTRRSVRAIPALNTRSKGDKSNPESDILRRKTRSAVSEGEGRRKRDVK